MWATVVVAQLLLVTLGIAAAIYSGSVWLTAPPLVLAFALTAGRRRRRASEPEISRERE
jgi:hypothetical protein